MMSKPTTHDLTWAIQNGNETQATTLIQDGLNPNITIGHQPLLEYACQHHSYDFVKLLLEHHADPSYSAIYGVYDVRLLKLLHEHGAILDNDTLVQAAMFGDPEVVEYLLSHGQGITQGAITGAYQCQNIPALTLLIKTAPTSMIQKAMHLVPKYRNIEVYQTAQKQISKITALCALDRQYMLPPLIQHTLEYIYGMPS